jgi:hypothetical protein
MKRPRPNGRSRGELREVCGRGNPHGDAPGQADRSALDAVSSRGSLARGRAEASNGSRDAGRGVQQYGLLRGRSTRA